MDQTPCNEKGMSCNDKPAESYPNRTILPQLYGDFHISQL